MKSDREKTTVTLEDLLRLKRAERPAPSFWLEFDRELRAKQLAALVVERPWWRTLPARAIAGVARYHLPMGASAILALTFLSVREYRTAVPEAGLATPVLEFSTQPRPESPDGNVIEIASVRDAAPDVRPVATVAEQLRLGAGEGSSGEEIRPVSAMVALIGGTEENGAILSPSARSISEIFSGAQEIASVFGNRTLMAAASQGFESRVLPARQPVVDPLAQMKAPSDVRRARYLGTALPAIASAKPVAARSSERLASRIADQRLYESGVSRLGLGGDRLMVKF